MDTFKRLPREPGCNLSFTKLGVAAWMGGQVTARAGPSICSDTMRRGAPEGPPALSGPVASRLQAGMGNKQTVFSHEQLEEYQVGARAGSWQPGISSEPFCGIRLSVWGWSA